MILSSFNDLGVCAADDRHVSPVALQPISHLHESLHTPNSLIPNSSPIPNSHQSLPLPLISPQVSSSQIHHVLQSLGSSIQSFEQPSTPAPMHTSPIPSPSVIASAQPAEPLPLYLRHSDINSFCGDADVMKLITNFYDDLSKFKKQQTCSICFEASISTTCKRCADEKKKHFRSHPNVSFTPKFGAANNMLPLSIPFTTLPKLTLVEEMCVSRVAIMPYYLRRPEQCAKLSFLFSTVSFGSIFVCRFCALDIYPIITHNNASSLYSFFTTRGHSQISCLMILAQDFIHIDMSNFHIY